MRLVGMATIALALGLSAWPTQGRIQGRGQGVTPAWAPAILCTMPKASGAGYRGVPG